MLCYSCKKQKNQLHPVESKILKGQQLLMCQTCVDSKYEPRWVIVMAGRQFGIDFVKDYVLKRRYYGDLIFADELLVG